MGSHLDSLLSQLGTGKWNIIHFVFLSYCFSLPAYHTLGGAFLVPGISYTCDPPPSVMRGDDPTHDPNADTCGYLAHSTVSGMVVREACTRWRFDNTTFSTTITSEFKLVCGREYLRATYTSTYMFGVLVGAPLNGHLADKYGRKPTVAIGSIMYFAIAIVSFWLPSFPALLTARFLMGTLHSAIIKSGYILALEVSEPRLRSVLGILLYLPWAFGTMALGGFAYLVRDWRKLHLLVSLLCLPFLPALLILDESPRWLAVRGYHNYALQVLLKAARWNKAVLPPPHRILQIVKEGENEQISFRKTAQDKCQENTLNAIRGFFILFRTRRLRTITLAMYVNYVCVGMVYFGLSLSGGQFSTNPFAYMVLMGLVEVPAYTVVIPIVVNYGRRYPTFFFFLFSGVLLLALPFIPKGCGWVRVTLAMAGKMIITSLFQILSLYSSELFPTEVRTWGTSTAFMMSRVGSVASPFITEYLGTDYPWVPSVVFGASSLVAGIATLTLPETLGIALPDTIDHLEKRISLTVNRNIFRFLLRDPPHTSRTHRGSYSRHAVAEVNALVELHPQHHLHNLHYHQLQRLYSMEQEHTRLQGCSHPSCSHGRRKSSV